MLQRRIIVLLFEKVHLMDIAGPIQVFYEARNLCKVSLQITFAAANSKVISEQGLVFCELKPLENIEIQASDLICIPGIDFKVFQTKQLHKCFQDAATWVRQAYVQGASISTICSGSLILAEMGLLDYRKCTCHWKCLDYFQTHYPTARLQGAKIYTEDRRIYTSAGMAAGIDMALYLLEKWYGAFVVARVAQEMVVSYRREGERVQEGVFSNIHQHFHPDINKIQELLLNHPEENYTLDMLAAKVNKSPRHLTRLFKEHTGKTIQAYKTEVRLEYGKSLLQNNQLSIEEIAQRCGFENARQFRRIWKATYGVSPKTFRTSF
ncbi:MAG: helix-turn-helix domain-containing protein [Saprospiraceae bacterium]|nr:helix-turn-helix domain-containing protein [Saprospiraceae bacterium]